MEKLAEVMKVDNWADDEDEETDLVSEGFMDRYPPSPGGVLISNLPGNFSRDEVQELFRRSKILDIRILQTSDESTTCWIDFANDSDVSAALKKDREALWDKQLCIIPATNGCAPGGPSQAPTPAPSRVSSTATFDQSGSSRSSSFQDFRSGSDRRGGGLSRGHSQSDRLDGGNSGRWGSGRFDPGPPPPPPPPPQQSAAPAGSMQPPRLNLSQRTASEPPASAALATASPGATVARVKSNPFGDAKPVDTASKLKELEAKISQRKEEEAKAEAEAKKKAAEEVEEVAPAASGEEIKKNQEADAEMQAEAIRQVHLHEKEQLSHMQPLSKPGAAKKHSSGPGGAPAPPPKAEPASQAKDTSSKGRSEDGSGAGTVPSSSDTAAAAAGPRPNAWGKPGGIAQQQQPAAQAGSQPGQGGTPGSSEEGRATMEGGGSGNAQRGGSGRKLEGEGSRSGGERGRGGSGRGGYKGGRGGPDAGRTSNGKCEETESAESSSGEHSHHHLGGGRGGRGGDRFEGGRGGRGGGRSDRGGRRGRDQPRGGRGHGPTDSSTAAAGGGMPAGSKGAGGAASEAPVKSPAAEQKASGAPKNDSAGQGAGAGAGDGAKAKGSAQAGNKGQELYKKMHQSDSDNKKSTEKKAANPYALLADYDT